MTLQTLKEQAEKELVKRMKEINYEPEADDLWPLFSRHISEAHEAGRREVVEMILENVDDDTRQDLESYKFIQEKLTGNK